MEAYQLVYNMTQLFLVVSVLTWITSFFVHALSLVFKDTVAFYFWTFFQAIPYYFLVSFSFLIVKGLEEEYGSSYTPFLAGLFLLLYLMLGNWNTLNDAYKRGDFELARSVHYRWYIMCAALIFYVFTFFDPYLVYNSMTIGFFDLVIWLEQFKIYNILMRAAATIYLIYLVIAMCGMIADIIRFRNHKVRYETPPNVKE